MPSDIDASPPPWLQRNWAPREPFDPTPWLQERYRRQVQQSKLPLELQQMELQNAAAKLGIEHQGMVNELQGMQLQKYQEELPLFQQAIKETGGDPTKILNRVQSFQSPLLQDQWTSMQHQAANTLGGLLQKERVVNQMKQVYYIQSHNGSVPEPGADGMYDQAQLNAATEAIDKREQEQELERIAARYGAMNPPASLETKVINGRTFIVNGRTGNVHMVPGVTKQDFIAKNITRWMESESVSSDEAAKMLSEIYDKNIGIATDQPQQQAPTGNDPLNIRGLLK